MIRNCNCRDRLKLYAIDTIFCAIFSTAFLMAFLVVSEIIIWLFLNDSYRYTIGNIGLFLTEKIWIVYPFFKDLFFKNGSIAKKILKVKVIDSTTGERPTIKKLILRNIFFPVKLIDLIVSCRRLDSLTLGDLITRTRVVYCEDNLKFSKPPTVYFRQTGQTGDD